MRFFFPLTTLPQPELQSIEVASSFQIPSFQIVGLPGPEVSESRERVRAAIEASGLEFPRRRVVLNLAPASVRKHGTGSDLAMALAILAHGRDLDREGLPAESQVAAWGELGLDGSLKGCGHATRALYAATRAKIPWFIHAPQDRVALHGARTLLTHAGDAPPQLIEVESLGEAWHWALKPTSQNAERAHSSTRDASPIEPIRGPELLPIPGDLVDPIGISLAGHHALLLLGPRGSGKSVALEQAMACMPQSSPKTQLLRQLNRELAISHPLHATGIRVGPDVRPGGLLGGWSAGAFRPGALAAAHEGLLLGDELPEWSRDSLEILRGPLESGSYPLHRKEGALQVDARFLFLATGNLCPCGGVPHELRPRADDSSLRLPACSCSLARQSAYRSRLSGPILDRIDIGHLLVTRPLKPDGALTAEHLRARITHCRQQLSAQWGALPGQLSAAALESLLADRPPLQAALAQTRYGSLRSRHKILRLALTIAAWRGEGEPNSVHLWQAERMRPECILTS